VKEVDVKHAAIALAVLTMVVGCRTTTRQSLSASVDDATTPPAVKSKTPAPTGAAPAASPPSTGYVLTRVMSGRVTSVDPASGALGLATAEGDMLVQFPRAMLTDLHVGDEVTVQVDLKPAR
jgi:hypothetical protein